MADELALALFHGRAAVRAGAHQFARVVGSDWTDGLARPWTRLTGSGDGCSTGSRIDRSVGRPPGFHRIAEPRQVALPGFLRSLPIW